VTFTAGKWSVFTPVDRAHLIFYAVGTGGESIYGEKFEDEAFPANHTRPFLLSMVRCGPIVPSLHLTFIGTACRLTQAPTPNGSQFFITCTPTSQSGWEARRLWRGHSRQIPWHVLPSFLLSPPHPINSTLCPSRSSPDRELPNILRRRTHRSHHDHRRWASSCHLTRPFSETVVASDGDPYEDYPEDDSRRPRKTQPWALEAARRALRELGTARWKDGTNRRCTRQVAEGLALPSMSTRFLPDDAAPGLEDEFNALRTPLLLNSAPRSTQGTWRHPGRTHRASTPRITH